MGWKIKILWNPNKKNTDGFFVFMQHVLFLLCHDSTSDCELQLFPDFIVILKIASILIIFVQSYDKCGDYWYFLSCLLCIATVANACVLNNSKNKNLIFLTFLTIAITWWCNIKTIPYEVDFLLLWVQIRCMYMHITPLKTIYIK